MNKCHNETTLILKLVNERCLISYIHTDSTKIAIVNVYAPCVVSEKLTFLNYISTQISEFCDDHLLLMGDFNTVLNNNLDIISGEKHNYKVVNEFNALVSSLLLVDIWRVTHPLKKEFTWNKDNPYTARRIDYALVSESLTPFCKDPNIKHVGFSDHKATTLTIDFSSFKRGPSTYKFNVSLLKNIGFVNEVTSEILRIKALELDPHLCWEYIKISIKDIAMKYGRALAFKKRNAKNILIDEIESLEKKLLFDPNDLTSLKLCLNAKSRLELIFSSEAEGARIRSGQKWAKEGERCSKFFLGLEKQRSNDNTIFNIETQSNPSRFSSDPLEILNTIKTYFKNVYSISPVSNTNDAIF